MYILWKSNKGELKMLKKPDLNKPAFQMYPLWRESIINGLCPECSKKIVESEFKDEIRKKEYSISGLCMDCQSKAFKNEF